MDSDNYSLRKPQKRPHYVDDDTTPSDSSRDVEYAPREKYNCFAANENVNTSKRTETSDESLSIGTTPSPKHITAASHEKDESPQQGDNEQTEPIQSHNISSSSEEDIGNDDFEMGLLKIQERADENIFEVKAKGAVERAKIDEHLKRIEEETKIKILKIDENFKRIEKETKIKKLEIDENLKRIEKETKIKILEIDEQRQIDIIRNKEKYDIARAKILSRKKLHKK